MFRYLIAAAGLAACTPMGQITNAVDLRLDNGFWFDGSTFQPRTVAIQDGKLTFPESEVNAREVLDLDGGFVVPPYCEGHNHNFGGSTENVSETVTAYLRDGVYYAMMPGSFELYRSAIEDQLNHPQSVDVAFANNGITGPGGHPRGLRESLMDRWGLYPEFTKETLPDKGYFEVDSLAELHSKWALVKSENTDFIKVMLFHSEEYEQRKNDPEAYGRRGLNPSLLPELVKLANAANLRVAAHVESGQDMATAIMAGVSIIEHMPSHDSEEILTDAVIKQAAKAGTAIVTTASIANRQKARDPDKYAAIIKAQQDNLSRLQAAGVKLVLGSDNVRDTSKGEAKHLAGLGVLSNQTLLTMWTTNCANTAFPERKIGQLLDGYEASFLVLDKNPLEDFDNSQSIRLRMKDGQWLDAFVAED